MEGKQFQSSVIIIKNGGAYNFNIITMGVEDVTKVLQLNN